MSETYKVEVNGQTIEYGAYTKRSRFADAEWSAIYHQIVKENMPTVYEDKKKDSVFIDVAGALIDLGERYEALLELLPQSSFSKAGTHPQWVADAVEENTLNKVDTQSDVKDMLKDADNIDDLKQMMIDYFELNKVLEVN